MCAADELELRSSARYPGIRTVGHVFFYAVNGADDETGRKYLDRAYSLGQEFAQPNVTAA
jgi:hypothetical protein